MALRSHPLARLGQQTSHPLPLLKRWEQGLGRDQTMALAAHNLVQPPIIVTGTNGPPPSGEPHDQEGFAVFGGDRAALEALLAERSGARVQDPAAAAPVTATAGLIPQLIVEVCAGRGTKTRQLAAVHPQARIMASDTSPAKLDTLREAFAGHEQVSVVEREQLLEFAGKADLVVVDAPCSNTGVLARRVEAKYRFGPRNLERLVALQRQILADALRLPAVSGHVLYCTCSLEPEENEQQADWIEQWHPMRSRRRERTLPRGLPGEPPGRYTDGSFFALLRHSP